MDLLLAISTVAFLGCGIISYAVAYLAAEAHYLVGRAATLDPEDARKKRRLYAIGWVCSALVVLATFTILSSVTISEINGGKTVVVDWAVLGGLILLLGWWLFEMVRKLRTIKLKRMPGERY